MLSILLVMSPVAAGVLAGLWLSSRVGPRSFEFRLLMVAACIYLSYFLITAAIFVVDSWGLRVFAYTNFYPLILVVACAIVYLIISPFKMKRAAIATANPKRRVPSMGKLHALTYLYIFIFIALVLYHSSSMPLSSWDGLGHWSVWPKLFIEYDFGLYEHRRGSRTLQSPFPLNHRHPLTLVFLGAFSAVAQSLSGFFVGWMISSSIIYLCGAATVYAATTIISGSKLIGAIITLGYFSLPLLENHAVLLGYAEMWIVGGVVLAIALVSVAISTGCRATWILGLIVCATPLFVKNTGILYFSAVAVPSFLLFAKSRISLLSLAMTALLAVIAVSVLVSFMPVDFSFQVLGTKVFLGRELLPVIEMLDGRRFVFGGTALCTIFENHFYMLVKNSSFSVLGLLLLISIIVYSAGSLRGEPKLRQIFAFLVSSATLMLLGFALMQLSGDFSSRYSLPGSDTGSSRFLLPVGPIVLLLCSLLWRAADVSQDTGKNRMN